MPLVSKHWHLWSFCRLWSSSILLYSCFASSQHIYLSTMYTSIFGRCFYCCYTLHTRIIYSSTRTWVVDITTSSHKAQQFPGNNSWNSNRSCTRFCVVRGSKPKIFCDRHLTCILNHHQFFILHLTVLYKY